MHRITTPDKETKKETISYWKRNSKWKIGKREREYIQDHYWMYESNTKKVNPSKCLVFLSLCMQINDPMHLFSMYVWEGERATVSLLKHKC